MNLITKTTLLYLLLAILVFGAGGVVAYNLIRQEVQKETNIELRTRARLILKGIEDGIPEKLLISDKVTIQKVDEFRPEDTLFVFSDTLAPHPRYKDQMEPHRKLTVVRHVNEQAYRISITDVFIERDDIYESVVGIMTRLFALLGITLFIFSFLITKWLFFPFQKTLERIGAFSIKSNEKINLPDTTTTEFKRLNSFISQMMTKARHDYKAVKEFSENASHEIQTPLSVAQGDLELLLDTPDLNEEQIRLIQDTQNSLDNLSKLVKALLLLTKVENREFSAGEEIDFAAVVRKIAKEFEELAELKGLSFKQRIQDNVSVVIDPAMADILMTNLLRNTIRHNIDCGWISIELQDGQLRVTNTGLPPTVPTHLLFERFQKGHQVGGSLGMGLSIVKKICEVNDLDVRYDFDEGVHRISVKFPQ